MDDIIDQLYRAAGGTQSWSAALDALAGAFDSQAGVLGYSHRLHENVELAVATGQLTDEAAIRGYHEHYAGLDPAMPYFRSLAPGTVTATSQVWPLDQARRFEFFSDYYEPVARLHDFMGATIVKDDDCLFLVGVQRARDARIFSTDDIERFRSLMPHLRRALQLHDQVVHLKQQNADLVQALDSLGTAVLVVGSDGAVRHMNAAARSVIARDDGFALDAARAPVTPLRAVERLVRDVLVEGGPGGFIRLPRRGADTDPYAVLVSRLPSAAGETLHERNALVVLHDPEHGRDDLMALLADEFRLTTSEARLLAALVDGKAVADYCRSVRISTNTAKFHLRALFGKIGVNTQTQLVRVALSRLGATSLLAARRTRMTRS